MSVGSEQSRRGRVGPTGGRQARPAAKPEPRQAAADRRTGYLDAAEWAFVNLGYEGASMRTIADGAGIGLGTIT